MVVVAVISKVQMILVEEAVVQRAQGPQRLAEEETQPRRVWLAIG